MGIPVAIDVTPLAAVRTGVGNSIAHLLAAFGQLAAPPDVIPYALSLRARAQLPAATRIPLLPARMLLASWGRADSPKIDRWLRPARVIHATNYLTPPSATPTVVTIHDCSFVRHPDLCSEDVRALVPVVRRALRRGATAHVPSHFVASEVRDIFGADLASRDHVVVIPWGIPPVTMPVRMSDGVAAALGAPYILALGAMEPRKNLPHLVAAFGAVAAANAAVRLVLAGPDGEARPSVDAAIANLSADAAARVIITGTVSDADRAALLTHAAVLAYPSVYEGFGFPALEAMSVNVPVVAARAGAIPEIVGDAADLVTATDEPALAAALLRLVDDLEYRADVVARGRDQARRYSWETTARDMTALYRRLAS